MTTRVGLGVDAHSLKPSRPLILGGIHVPFRKGLSGHSDGDVVVHAIMDALLGAAGLGDKGQHFPSTNPALKGISSLALLAKVGSLLTDNGWQIVNLDATILAQQPRLTPFVNDMMKKIAATLKTDFANIHLKATTTDHLGFTGREEGISAYVVVLIKAN